MTSGLSEDLQQISDARKTAVINNELNRLHMDIVALQETRLAESGVLREKDYSFFWQGKATDETREHGVGFAVRNNLLDSIIPPTGGSERLLRLQLQTSAGPVSLISTYAPTLTSAPELKDRFYDDLSATVNEVPPHEPLFILGDFNARVGADHNSWPNCLGHFGIGKMNENGQRLLELCCHHDLSITNTFFMTKPQHKVSWRHPRSKHWHQLDLVLTWRVNLNNTKLTRSFHSADCDTDHSLVCCIVKFRTQRIYRTKKEGRPRINTNKTLSSEKVEEFVKILEEAIPGPTNLNASERWQLLRDKIYDAAMLVFGKKHNKTADWFESHLDEMQPLLDARRQALALHKNRPSEKTLHELRSTPSKIQQTARRCGKDYWLELCGRVQVCADTGNLKGMYDGIKQATGPTQKKTAAPLKDSTKKMEHWVEHYSELYSRENIVSQDALNVMESLPTLDELDSEPTLEELSQALDQLACGKAPGKDGIPAEVIKCAKGTLLKELHEILSQCWREGAVPQDMRDAHIINLYKNKGDRSDCNNYRGISLLNIVGKLFARVVLRRVQGLAERVYPESQCGFRPRRSTVDMIFSLRQLQEKCREQGRPLYVAFIDLIKAFDLVSRDGLFKILAKIGCPPTLLKIVKSFHDDMKGTIVYDGSTSDPFDIRSGVKQGCVLAPTLFGVFFAILLKHAFGNSTEGIYLRIRTDGNLFRLSRLKAKTKVKELCIRDFLFGDDAAITTHTQEELQRLLECFSDACKHFGLTISRKKTQVIGQDTMELPSFHIDDYQLEVVHEFVYLGSTITDNLSLENEINKRIGKAATTLSRLTKRVWSNKRLTEHTKGQVYKACVISTLLYGSESWTMHARQERRLNAFHLRCLRRILDISWQDKVSNNTVLQRTGMSSMYTLLKQRRLRWLGHVTRMKDGRLPKDIMYGELVTGKRPQGRPQLRFKDVCKRDLKALDISTNSYEVKASDRDTWRHTVKSGLNKFETSLKARAEEKRVRRKIVQDLRPSTFTCTKCGRDCHSSIGLYSHTRGCRVENFLAAQTP